MKNLLKKLSLLLAFALLLAGCAPVLPPQQGSVQQPSPEQPASPVATPQPAPKVPINVATIKGPSGIGMVGLIEKSETGAESAYEFIIESGPETLVGKLSTGEVDIATVPPNLAASLYNKTNGGIVAAAIYTLGTLYVVELGDSVQSVSDLSGKTVYASGQGSVPEYALSYILGGNNIADVSVEYKGEYSEVAALMASGEVTLAMLPEPFVSSVLMKNAQARVALDLTAEYKAVSGGTNLLMGCVVARKEFVQTREAELNEFLAQFSESIAFANADVAAAAALCEKYDIMNAGVAQKAIPNCNLTYIQGAQAQVELDAFYNVLFGFEPKSVGGKVPDEEFYYKG